MTGVLPNVALIVVAYHHEATLPATLAALDSLTYPANKRTTIIVDNGSEGARDEGLADGGSEIGGSKQEIPQSKIGYPERVNPKSKILRPGRNLGFAGGCNLAVAQTDAEIVVLINPDLEVRPDFLDHIVAPLADPQVGIVGAKLLYPDERTIQHAGGFLIEPTMLAQHHGYGAINEGQWDQPRDVAFVTGAALAMRRSTWQELGGLDEAFFPAYFEEVDLCWRAALAGYRVRYEPRAVAIHREAAGLGKGSEPYHTLYHRNRLRLLWKHRPNDWLLHTWLPAEFTHLRATADDNEIAGLMAAYRFWQSTFLAVNDQNAIPQPQTAASDLSELEWTLQQLAAKRIIAPQPFRSRWPLVARARTLINRLATEDYIRPLIQQQNDYNAAVAELAAALARQRRTVDAAILCQATLLAKMVRSKTENREQRTENKGTTEQGNNGAKE